MTNEVKSDSTTINPSPVVQSPSPIVQDAPIAPEIAQAPVQNENFIKKIGVVPIVIATVLVILLVGGIVFKTITSSPKAVFKNTINNLYKGLNNGIDGIEEFSEKFDLENKALILNGDIKLNLSDGLTEDIDININDYSLGGELGIDINNEILQATAFIKGKKEKIDIKTYFEDGVVYGGSNLFDGLIKIEDTTIDFDEFQELFDEIEENMELDSENYDYVIKAIKDAIVKSLDNEYMKKENDEIKIAGKKVKVTKFSYTINDKAAQSMARNVADILLDDKDFAKKFSKLTGVEKEEVEEFLKEMKKSAKEIEFEEKIVLNVFQKGLLNTPVGFNLKIDKKEYIHYYTDGGNIDFKYDDNSSSEYSKTVFEVISEKDKKESKVSIKYNDEEVGKLVVRELSDKLIDFDYEIIEGDETLKGSIYLSYNEDKTSIKGEYKFSLEYDGESLSAEGTYGIESRDNLERVEKNNIISEYEIDEEEVLKNLEKIAENDDAFKELYDMVSEEYELSKNKTNSYGMYELLNVSDIKKLMSKDGGAVLFVGSSYYSMYSDEDSYNLVNNLQKVQNELDFHSYYFSNYAVNAEFKEIFKDVAAICKTSEENSVVPPIAYNPENEVSPVAPKEPNELPDQSKCNEYPIVYFIKDGTVIKAIQGTATEEELKEMLKEIGIE